MEKSRVGSSSTNTLRSVKTMIIKLWLVDCRCIGYIVKKNLWFSHELAGKKRQENQSFHCRQAGDLQDWAVVEADMEGLWGEAPSWASTTKGTAELAVVPVEQWMAAANTQTGNRQNQHEKSICLTYFIRILILMHFVFLMIELFNKGTFIDDN